MNKRATGWTVLALTLSGCGGGSGTPSTPPPPPADFALTCQPAGFAAGRGCGTSTCTVTGSNGFAASVALSCQGQPAGLACDFGPNPLPVPTGGGAATGFVVNADARVPAQVHSFQVVAQGGALRRTASVQVQTGPVGAPVSTRDMTLTGCAGYVGGVTSVPGASFRSVYVGAWGGGAGQSFCGQTLSEEDGSFVLQIAPRCVADGDPLYLTAGGLDTCRTAPFERGGAAHLSLFGRTGRCP
jgi:hypothetical protein